MGHQALGVAEIVGDADQPQGVHEPERALLAALHLEGDHGRAAGHLAGDELGLRVVRAARIDERCDLGMRGEEIGEVAGRFGLPLDAQRQRLEPLSSTQALKGESVGPGHAQELLHVRLDEVGRGQDDAAETPALAVDVLGGRIDDAIGARAREGV